jgi:hypothetical protein
VKIKLKGRHFDTTEVIEAESQAMLNTLAEQDFHDEVDNGRSAGNGAYEQKGTTSRMMVVRRPKVSTDQITAPVPEIMDDSLHIQFNH